MENLVKIEYKEIGKLIANKFAIEESTFVSDETHDWEDAFCESELVEENGNKYLYLYRIEIIGNPRFIEFYEENVIDENDFIIERNYYIEKCNSKYLDKDFLKKEQDEKTRESLELIEKLKINLRYLQSRVDRVYNEDIESTLESLREIKKDLMRLKK